MTDIIKALNQLENFEFMDGVSEKDIIEAEMKLGMKFASDYRCYLSTYGLASADGHEFTGIIKSPRLNVVDVTIRLKKKFKDALDDAYVLEELGIDEIVVFQISNGNIYQASPSSEFIKIANSFSAYLKM